MEHWCIQDFKDYVKLYMEDEENKDRLTLGDKMRTLQYYFQFYVQCTIEEENLNTEEKLQIITDLNTNYHKYANKNSFD